MTKTERCAVIEECARACELTAETCLVADQVIGLTLADRIRGSVILWNQRASGYEAKQQLLSMAKILRGMENQ